MATTTLWLFPDAGSLLPAADFVYISQSNTVRKITIQNLGLYNGGVLTGTPADPTGTTSATAVMMGLAQLFTPGYSGRVKVDIVGLAANNTILDGYNIQIRYGTGAAPANGVAVTGTAVGAAQTAASLVAAQKVGFCLTAIITGLAVGTQIWLDIALNRVTGGTATITNITVTAHEV